MTSGVHYLDAAGPEGIRLYAIGDIHGRLDLLAEMHARIEADLADRPAADWRVIHLGDYVDRGPDSRGVIDFLISAQARDGRNLAVCGNHDAGFLDYLTSPDAQGLFALFGGATTALSYGVVNPDFSDQNTASELGRLVPNEHRQFIKKLPFSLAFGDFFFCHAGIRPGVALDAQAVRDLIWIRGEFLHSPILHPKIIVHGHTPRSEPEILANRVNLDTEAWRTGTLSAIAVDGKDKRLLQVFGPPA